MAVRVGVHRLSWRIALNVTKHTCNGKLSNSVMWLSSIQSQALAVLWPIMVHWTQHQLLWALSCFRTKEGSNYWKSCFSRLTGKSMFFICCFEKNIILSLNTFRQLITMYSVFKHDKVSSLQGIFLKHQTHTVKQPQM